MQISKKNRLTIILAIALVAVLAVGGSLAYLATLTNQIPNAFSFAENIKARLDEPNWDPDDAQNLIPGYEVRKDPMVTNVSNNEVDEFTAIRVSFTDGAGNLLSNTAAATDYVGRLLRILNITWNTADWELLDASYQGKAEQIWVYKDKLVPGETTPALFDTVTIKSVWDGSESTLGSESVLPDWDTEFAWLASVVLNHTDACYTYGTHNAAAPCTIAYRHHANCALFDGTGTAAQIEAAAKGATVGGKTCDCEPVEIHSSKCPYDIGTINCSEPTHVGSGIDGFEIVLRAAAVQAAVDGMTTYNAAATKTALTALFTANPYI